jgi:hypothetical protein
MKPHQSIAGIFLFVILSFAFIVQDKPGSIKGRVVPYNAALNVWAVSDNDTAHAVVQNGAFEIKALKAGRYRVIVEGLKPYKVTTKPDVIVSNGVITDVKDIILDQ